MMNGLIHGLRHCTILSFIVLTRSSIRAAKPPFIFLELQPAHYRCLNALALSTLGRNRVTRQQRRLQRGRLTDLNYIRQYPAIPTIKAESRAKTQREKPNKAKRRKRNRRVFYCIKILHTRCYLSCFKSLPRAHDN